MHLNPSDEKQNHSNKTNKLKGQFEDTAKLQFPRSGTKLLGSFTASLWRTDVHNNNRSIISGYRVGLLNIEANG